MKKRIFLILIVLSILLLVVSCGPKVAPQPDPELEKELDQLSDDELKTIAEAGEKSSGALAGKAQAYVNKVKIGKKVSPKVASAAAQSVLDKRKLVIKPMTSFKQKYSKLGLTDTDLYQDLLKSNTLLYDSRKDYFLLHDLNVISNPKASKKDKDEAKTNVEKKINQIYAKFDAASLDNTGWMFAAEKFYKDMLLDGGPSYMDIKLMSPDQLQKFLDQQGACVDSGAGKTPEDVTGGDKSGKKADTSAGKTEGAKGGASDCFFGEGGMGGGKLGAGLSTGGLPSSLQSIIACMEAYKASKSEDSWMGGKGGPVGGGVNPGPGSDMTGGVILGGNAPVTTGEDGSGGVKGVGGGGKGKCFGVDMGKMQDYAGKKKQESKSDHRIGVEKKMGEHLKQQKKDGYGKSGGAVAVGKGGGFFDVVEVLPASGGGTMKITTSYEMEYGPDGSTPKQLGDPSNQFIPDKTPGQVIKEVTDQGGVIAEKPPAGTKPSTGSEFNPEFDSGAPCGADVSGFVSCLMGTQGKTPQEQWNDIKNQCMVDEPAGNVPKGKGEKGATTTTAGGKQEGAKTKKSFSTQGACSAFGPGCMSYMNNLYGQGSGIKDVSADASNSCGIDAKEAMETIMQTLITDPFDWSGMSLSSMVADSAGIILMEGKGLSKAAAAIGEQASAGTGAASKGTETASSGQTGCVGTQCN